MDTPLPIISTSTAYWWLAPYGQFRAHTGTGVFDQKYLVTHIPLAPLQHTTYPTLNST
jgi:hypothetical protein